MPQQLPMLSLEERREKHKLYLRDGFAFSVLAGLVIALSFVTYFLFHSFSAHRQLLENRWRVRGEAALAAGNPIAALDSLHSALAYAPGNRRLQIELATALAAAGRTHEAEVYFTTLLESEPGSGLINLELARLSLKQNNSKAAADYYQAAIDGTWNGDAFTRRRAIRLELARFLIAQGTYPEARSLLVITGGNSPNDHALQMTVGGLLEQAQDPADAFEIYRKAAKNRATRLAGLEGAGRTALALGRFAEAKRYFGGVVGEPGLARRGQEEREAVHADLKTATGALALYPAEKLPMAERARRIAQDAELAQARLLACPAAASLAQGAQASPAPAPSQRAALLAGLAAHLRKLNPLAGAAAPPPSAPSAGAGDTLALLAARWTSMATGADLVRQLTANPDLARQTMQLVYQTEIATAAACGAPTGEDALLLRIAQAPEQVEAEQ